METALATLRETLRSHPDCQKHTSLLLELLLSNVDDIESGDSADATFR